MFEGMNWSAFWLAMAVVELTPGPNMGWLTTLSAHSGRAAGLRAVAGVTLGMTLQLIAALIGLSALIAGSPTAYEALRWAGVAFMLYLAWEAWQIEGESSPGTLHTAENFRRGLIANLLNPKALVFYVAVVGQFADASRGALWPQILILGILHVFLAFLVHVGVVLLGASLGQSLDRWRNSLPVRLLFAACLVGIAVWIAILTDR